jgi:LPXTG-motif cell wall-anchored protein
VRNVRGRLAGLAATAVLTIAGGFLLHSPAASAANTTGQGHGSGSGVLTQPQQPSNADFSGHGANVHGAYDSTRDGSPSGNGNGNGKAVGKPCAGCVGKADNKNPHGQQPNGSDHNAGYECDRNHGIGRTNPAHTGCKPSEQPPPPPCDAHGTPCGPPPCDAHGTTPCGPPGKPTCGEHGKPTCPPPPHQTPPASPPQVGPVNVGPVNVGPANVPPVLVPPTAESGAAGGPAVQAAATLPNTGGRGELTLLGIGLVLAGAVLVGATRTHGQHRR